MNKIKRVEEETVMKQGKIICVNYHVWYYNIPSRDYRQCTGRLIPMTVLNFILDENNEAITRYQEFDGKLYKRTIYKEH